MYLNYLPKEYLWVWDVALVAVHTRVVLANPETRNSHLLFHH